MKKKKRFVDNKRIEMWVKHDNKNNNHLKVERIFFGEKNTKKLWIILSPKIAGSCYVSFKSHDCNHIKIFSTEGNTSFVRATLKKKKETDSLDGRRFHT